MVGKDAPTQQQLRETLQDISKAAQGISALTEYLEKNPEALIRGKSQGKP
jgi:paraquat-inducible protein B